MKKQALVVCLPPGEATRTLRPIWEALERPGLHFDRVYLISAAAEKPDVRVPRPWQQVTEHFKADGFSAQPKDADAYRPLVAYLHRTLLTTILSEQSFDRVGFAWARDGWAPWLAAGGAMRGLHDVSWWDPNSRDWVDDTQIGRAVTVAALEGRRPAGGRALDAIAGESKPMQRLRRELENRARLPFAVLLVGETGSGKELCARALHDLSGRHGRFVPSNASLLSPNFFESELFGHIRGAFSGAESDRTGRIREARNGTFFLDELSSSTLDVQSRLLRAFNRANEAIIEVVPMGAPDSRREDVPVRLVTAVQRIDDSLRSDLRYRVEGIRIDIPPLRDRGDDVIQLAEQLVARLREKLGDGPESLGRSCKDVLRNHDWPGNVRQLESTLRQAWLSCLDQGSSRVSSSKLQRALGGDLTRPLGRDLRERLLAMAEAQLEAELTRHEGKRVAAARALGFKTTQRLNRHMEKLRCDVGRSRKS